MSPGAGAGFFLEATGITELQDFLGDMQHELNQGLRERLKEAAGLISEEAKRQTHSARVRSAMSTTVTVRSQIDFEARIGPSRRRAWFAHFLEFGTIHSRDFPFLAPALAITEDQVVELVGFPPVLE